MVDFAPRFTITNRITAGLTAIERARGFLEAATLSDEWVRRMSQRALLVEAHATTHIEGAALTLAQAETVLAGGTVSEAREDDVRELLNYREAFNLVAEYVGGGEPITEGLLRDIHKKLVEGVRGGEGQPGQYRKIQNYVANSLTKTVIYTPPPPGAVPALMHDLVVWLDTESELHPVLVAGLSQFQLVQIHPFVDGNGRTSRLLSTLCLYRSGYDFKRLFTLSEYYDRDRSQFYQALQSVREHDLDLTPWLEFFVDGLATQLGEVKVRGELAIRRDVLVNQHRLNPRQAQAVEHLLQVGHIDLRTFQDLCPDGARRTLQRDLAGLEAKGLVVTQGGTNNLVYRLKGGA